MHYVYVLQSTADADDFYIGCTSDLRARLASHNRGANQSTRHTQWRVVYYEAYLSLSAARTREYRLKHHGSVKRHLFQRIRESLVSE